MKNQQPFNHFFNRLNKIYINKEAGERSDKTQKYSKEWETNPNFESKLFLIKFKILWLFVAKKSTKLRNKHLKSKNFTKISS